MDYSDDPVEEHVSLSAEDADEVQPVLAEQLERIRDYRANKFGTSSSRNAALRTISADLMEVEAYLAQAVRDEMDSGPLTVDELDTVEPAVDMMTRLAKQITQLAKLESQSRPSYPLPHIGPPLQAARSEENRYLRPNSNGG
jgi:hypothetical protein